MVQFIALLFLMWLPKKKNQKLGTQTKQIGHSFHKTLHRSKKKGKALGFWHYRNALTRPAGILIPGNVNGTESYLYGVGFELREDREGCGFAYGIGVGDRTRRRAAEGKEEALGGVSHVGGSIHRTGPRRLHPLLPLD